MNVFSASQAISPAIERTKSYLFRPFKWGTYLKLSLVACITEGFSSNFNFNSGHHSKSGTGIGDFTGFHFTNEIIALIVLAVLVFIAVCIVISYLVTRLRFAFFHCLIHQTKYIRPVWGLYRVQAMRYFMLSMIVGFISLVVLAMALVPFAISFYNLYLASKHGGHIDWVSCIALILALFLVILLLALICTAVSLTMRDFMLPHIALENASVRAAWVGAYARIKAEKGRFLFYAFLRVVLPALAMLALIIVLAIPVIIVFGILGISLAGFGAALAYANGITRIFLIAIEAILGLFTFVLALLMAISVGGPVATWKRNYALLFYGGRYQVLGDFLVPPPPTAPTTPAVS
jgi:hypothetical protein